MSKRYLGGGVSFEQENVYQEFSEETTPSGGGSLATLTDVDISDPVDGQTLVYNAEAGKWENGTSGCILLIREIVDETKHTLNKTWQQIHDADLPVVIYDMPDGDGTLRSWITYITVSDDNYSVTVDGVSYYADTASDYPSMTD